MKRLLLISIVQLLCFCLHAQTTAETALPLQEGANTYAFEGEGTNTAYFKYTAPAESGQLLTLKLAENGVQFQFTADGTYATQISSITSADGLSYTVPVSAGKDVIVGAQRYGAGEISFTASMTAANVDGGRTKDDAIEATKADFFVPSRKDANYQPLPVYLKYTAETSGALQMTFGTYMNSLKIQAGTEGEQTTLNAAYDGATAQYVAKYAVEAGETYYIETSAYSPCFASFEVLQLTEGASCDLPFAAVESMSNALPPAAGKYWYAFSPATSGFAVLSSEASLAGGTVQLFRTCSDYSPQASVAGRLSMRFAVTAGQVYLLCIEKTEATATEEAFALRVEEAKEGDTFQNPLAIEAGTHTVPEIDGKYYYKLTAPADAATYLVVKTDEAFRSAQTQMVLYNQAYGEYTSLATGTQQLRYLANPGQTYILRWDCNEGINAFDFTVAFEEIAQGDVASNPLPAVLGENDLKAGNAKFYTYTPTKTCRLVVETLDPTINVTFPRDASGYSYYEAVKSGLATTVEVEAGTAYLIKFEGMTMDDLFFLSEEDYKEGESAATALPIEAGSVNLSADGAFNVWYVYTAPQDGMLSVSSDMAYATDPTTYRPTALTVTVNDGTPQSFVKNVYDGSTSVTTFEGSVVVRAGDKVYINVYSPVLQTEKTLTVSLRDLEPGEDISNPIALTPGENLLPAATRSTPIWYSINLQDYFNLSVEAMEKNTPFSLELYRADNLNSSVAYSSVRYDEADNYAPWYYLNYAVGEGQGGDYYLKLVDCAGNVQVKVSSVQTAIAGAATAEGAPFRVGAGRIEAAAGVMLTVTDPAGRRVAQGTGSLSLPQGVYVVRAGNRTAKVVIR